MKKSEFTTRAITPNKEREQRQQRQANKTKNKTYRTKQTKRKECSAAEQTN